MHFLQCSLSNRSSTATIALPIQVSVQLFSFLPSTELIVSCILPNLYHSDLISNLFSISLQTEFPIWSSPIAIERMIEERYPSDFSPAPFFSSLQTQWSNPLAIKQDLKNLIPISTVVQIIPSGSITHARARATRSRMRLCRRFLIFFSFWIKFFYSLWEFHLKCFEFFVFFKANKFWDIINIYILYIGNSTCSMNI